MDNTTVTRLTKLEIDVNELKITIQHLQNEIQSLISALGVHKLDVANPVHYATPFPNCFGQNTLNQEVGGFGTITGVKSHPSSFSLEDTINE